VKETVLLRQLAAEIRGDHASAGGDLFHPGIDVTQEALARKGVFNPFHLVRVAYCQFFGGHGRYFRLSQSA